MSQYRSEINATASKKKMWEACTTLPIRKQDTKIRNEDQGKKIALGCAITREQSEPVEKVNHFHSFGVNHQNWELENFNLAFQIQHKKKIQVLRADSI